VKVVLRRDTDQAYCWLLKKLLKEDALRNHGANHILLRRRRKIRKVI
jgi:hypothetical protein